MHSLVRELVSFSQGKELLENMELSESLRVPLATCSLASVRHTCKFIARFLQESRLTHFTANRGECLKDVASSTLTLTCQRPSGYSP
jgi:hypothetical protein